MAVAVFSINAPNAQSSGMPFSPASLANSTLQTKKHNIVYLTKPKAKKIV